MPEIKLEIFGEKWQVKLSDEQEAAIKEALRQRLKYRPLVDNKAYQPTLPISASNPLQLLNPVSIEEWCSKGLLNEFLTLGRDAAVLARQKAIADEATRQAGALFRHATITRE